jgi:hypothetical protein
MKEHQIGQDSPDKVVAQIEGFVVSVNKETGEVSSAIPAKLTATQSTVNDSAGTFFGSTAKFRNGFQRAFESGDARLN